MDGYFDPDFDADYFDTGTGLTGTIPRGVTAAVGVPGRPSASVVVPDSISASVAVPARPTAEVD